MCRFVIVWQNKYFWPVKLTTESEKADNNTKYRSPKGGKARPEVCKPLKWITKSHLKNYGFCTTHFDFWLARRISLFSTSLVTLTLRATVTFKTNQVLKFAKLKMHRANCCPRKRIVLTAEENIFRNSWILLLARLIHNCFVLPITPPTPLHAR